MTDPNAPQHPGYQPYPGPPGAPWAGPPGAPWAGPPGAPWAGPPRRPGLGARLGERGVRRPEPRLGVSLAGAGIGLVVLGVLVWGGDYLTGGSGGSGGGSSRHLLGAALALIVVVAGYALAVVRRSGPLASAGVSASALSVPVLLGFLTFDTAHAGSGPPFSLDAVVLVSVLVWVISYLTVPGARGHAFYLGLAALTIWPYLVDKAEPATFSLAALVPSSVTSALGGAQAGSPDWTTVGVLSLAFGLGYYASAFLLDRLGRTGPGAALAVGGFFATASGIAAVSASLHAIGTGILLIAVGGVLAGLGARGARRFTTWIWSAGVALGAAVIIGKLTSNNSAAGGMALIAAGAVVVIIGHLLAQALHEPDDVLPGTAVPAGAGRLP